MKKQVNKKEFWTICKVQVSLAGTPSTLIYNEDRSVEDMTDRAFGERLLGEDLKGYFKCKTCHDGTLYFHKRVKDQDW